jgi:hypothetical protein
VNSQHVRDEPVTGREIEVLGVLAEGNTTIGSVLSEIDYRLCEHSMSHLPQEDSASLWVAQ